MYIRLYLVPRYDFILFFGLFYSSSLFFGLHFPSDIFWSNIKSHCLGFLLNVFESIYIFISSYVISESDCHTCQCLEPLSFVFCFPCFGQLIFVDLECVNMDTCLLLDNRVLLSISL